MQLQIFQYESDESHFDNLTTIEIEGEVWFVVSEVCKLLDIEANTTNAISSLDDDEKRKVTLSNAQNELVDVISESGLYALIFESKKPSAKKFRKWVTKEVIPAIRKTGSYGINRLETPNFVRRYHDNSERTGKGYFSVISELFIRLHGRFEHVGYTIPNKALGGKEIRPDTSVGKLFSTYLTKNYPEFVDKHKMYLHKFPNGSEFEARQYLNEVLPTFIKFVDEEWIPNRASEYFKDRDPKALEYLPKLLSSE